MRRVLIGVGVLAVLFGAGLWALNTFLLSNPAAKRPVLAEPPPLKPLSRLSTVVAPVYIANLAIRDVMEQQAPRNLTGQRENPLGDLVGKVDIGWNITRAPLTVTGRPEGITVNTTINGFLNAVGQLNQQTSQIMGQLGGILGDNLGREFQRGSAKPFDQRLDINGTVGMTTRPTLLPNWRFEPNLTANVTLADRAVNIGGSQLNVIGEVKPHLDRAMNEQMARLQQEMRNDPTLERTARREWAKMCRSISLGPATPDMPALWVEIKPVRAVAAQPRFDANWLTLVLGVHAETRIVSSETKPDCPFPAQLEILQPKDEGRIAIAVPVELPFTEINRILEAQLKGKTLPEEPNQPLYVTVQKATVAASGERLLITLKVKAQEKKSWFGLDADADVYIWGKPALDPQNQTLRFSNMTLDVESETAFGLAGAAARAAIPYVQKTLEQHAVIDLKPFAANARKGIDAAIAEFQSPTDGVKVEAAVTDLRMAGIEFDAKTLRVIAEVDGNARAIITKLAVQ